MSKIGKYISVPVTVTVPRWFLWLVIAAVATGAIEGAFALPERFARWFWN